MPETGAQGRVSAEDVASGRAALGYRCNTEIIGHYGGAGGQFKTLRYVDAAGHECAYFDTPQTNVIAHTGLSAGVQVLDMSNPRQPRLTDTLVTAGMLSPHESLLLNQRRGLLIAGAGSAATAPGITDVYDVTADCRQPVLQSSTPLGILGHESGFAPDGKTLYITSGGFGTIAAVDLTNPAQPQLLTVYTGAKPHGVRLSDDGKTMYVADLGQSPLGDAIFNLTPGPGLRILDVSQVQDRVPNPQITEIGSLDWPEKSTPQVPEPVTISGHHYLVEVDEFSTNITQYDPASRVGAARIISIDDPHHPRVVSNIRLEVNTESARSGPQQNDPNANLDINGYTAHYCSVPREVDPGIVACSFILSGLRIFDIRDPLHPREIAYFNPPGQNGGDTLSAATFVPERQEIWYTDETSGFWALRITNGAWSHAAGTPGAVAVNPPAAVKTAAKPKRTSKPTQVTGPLHGLAATGATAALPALAIALLFGAGWLRRRGGGPAQG